MSEIDELHNILKTGKEEAHFMVTVWWLIIEQKLKLEQGCIEMIEMIFSFWEEIQCNDIKHFWADNKTFFRFLNGNISLCYSKLSNCCIKAHFCKLARHLNHPNELQLLHPGLGNSQWWWSLPTNLLWGKLVWVQHDQSRGGCFSKVLS